MNKTVLVTGGSRGIGRRTIIEFAKHGYNVVINYVSDDRKAEELKNFVVENYNVDVMLAKCDVSDEEGVKQMVSSIIDKYGKIDVLVNNAVYENDDTYINKTKEDFIKTFEVNVFGAFNMIKNTSKYMDNGVVINISSRDAVDTYGELTIDYSASKAALNSITQSFSIALPNIKLISLLLPWINTESTKQMLPEYLESELKRTNQERLIEPEEVAKKIYNLSNDNEIDSGSIIKF